MPEFCIGEIPTCWYILELPNAKICVTPDASQWNIGGVGSSGIGHVYFMYISCIFHLVCASFSALASRKLADAKADSSGIWALNFTTLLINWHYKYTSSSAEPTAGFLIQNLKLTSKIHVNL